MLNDLTVGSPWKKILLFSLPLLLSTALQQIYNIADSVIVGQFTGSTGLAAVGAAYPITLFFVAVGTGAQMGCSVEVSRLFGARAMRDLKSCIYTCLIALTALGAALAVLGVLLSRPLMLLLGCDPAALDDAVSYLAIYSVGVLPMLVYNGAAAVYTGLGDSKRPLYFLLAAAITNIVLDLIAVGPLGMGVAGAAWATSFSQLVACLLSVVTLFRKISEIQVPEQEKVSYFDKRLLAGVSRIALPSILQQTCVALAHTIVQTLVNSFGTNVMGGYEAASKVHNFVYMCFNTLGTALSSFAAQCRGAGKRSRIREGYRISTVMCFGLTVAVVLVLQLFAPQLIGMFLDSSQEQAAIQVGVTYLRIISPDYLLICFVITAGGLLRGLGRIRDFTLVTLLDFAVRVSMSFVLTSVLDSYTGLFWPWYFGTIVDLIICVLIYRWLVRRGDFADPQGQVLSADRQG